MKKLYFLVLSLCLLSVPAFAIDEPTYRSNTQKLQVAGSYQSDAYREVRLVRNPQTHGDGVRMVSGDAVIWDTGSDDGVTVALTTTSADGAFAGILVTAIPTTDQACSTAFDHVGRANWGWVCTYGGPTLAKVSAGGTNNHSAKDFFITSADSGAVTTIANRTTTLAVQVGGQREVAASGGFFMDAATAANTLEEVFVKAE